MPQAPFQTAGPTMPSGSFEGELERVLASKTFVGSHRMRQFLRHVVELTLAGRIGELKEFQLGLEVFGRDSSYDPRIDPVVRVEARRLRAKLEEYYTGDGADDPVVITIPKGGYVAHFEPRLPASPSASPSGTPQSVLHPRFSWKFAGPAAFLIVAAVLAAVLHGNGLWTRVPPSVAVLPFVDLTGDPGRKYFSAGLTEEVTDELSRLKGMRVAAETSAGQFSPTEKDLRKIGSALNVDAVLQGTVEQTGGRVKVLARLERISDGSRLWSAVYNRRDDDLLDLQSEIARGIAYGLKATVNPQQAKQHLPHNQQAHDLYLKGRYEAQSLNPDSQTKAIQDFQSVIAQDPEFGAGYEALGSALLNRSTALVQPPDRKRIEGYWRKALSIDPDLTSAHEDVAIVAMQYDWDWDRAQRELQLALASGSGPSVEIREADYMLFHRRFSEADEYVARAQKLDPLGTSTIYNVGTIRAFEGRFAEARAQFEILAGREKSTLVEVLRDVFDIYDGHLDRGLADLRRFDQKFSPVKLLQAIAVSRQGQRAEALNLIHSIENSPAGKSAPLYWYALAYASLQDEPNTLKWLNRSADAHEWQALFSAVDPSFSWMRDHAGMRQLKRRIGLA